MNTRILTKLSMAIALVAVAVTIWEAGRVKAAAPPDPERSVGMVGITIGQTLRLNAVNLSPPPDPDTNGVPPGPCRVLLSFRNATGQPFINSNGEPVGRVVELPPGESAFLDLNADIFGAPSTNADVAPGPTRLQLRPFVRLLEPPPDPDKQSDPCRSTMEVFDNTTGRTSIFSVLIPPPDPDRSQ
jgi:hypothetical protein